MILERNKYSIRMAKEDKIIGNKIKLKFRKEESNRSKKTLKRWISEIPPGAGHEKLTGEKWALESMWKEEANKSKSAEKE